MYEDLNSRDSDYSLAQAAIHGRPWLSTPDSTDELARPAITVTQPDSGSTSSVVVRMQGPELTAEIRGGPVSPELRKALPEVLELLGLPPGWNSYSAKPVDPRNVARAIRVLGEFLTPGTRPPAVIPTVRGGIQLEWHCNGIDIEIYVESGTEVNFYAEDGANGETIEVPLPGHHQELHAWLKRASGSDRG